jgi:hypothetical protein
MSDVLHFLLRSSRKVIDHCEFRLASSMDNGERERLRRLIEEEERFLRYLAEPGSPHQRAA